MCVVEGFSVGVRGESLIGFEGIVGQKVGDEFTPKSSPVLLIRFVGKRAGVDSSIKGKGNESSVVVSFGLFNFCTRRSMNRS